MAPPPAYSLDRGPHAEIRLGRSLTAQVAASLCRTVTAHVDAGVAVLELHMPEVERIDSVGLAALHQVAAFAAERRVILTLVPSPPLHRALLDAHLLEAFTLATSLACEPEGTASGQILATSQNLALRLPTPTDLSHFDAWARDPLLAHMVGSDLL